MSLGGGAITPILKRELWLGTVQTTWCAEMLILVSSAAKAPTPPPQHIVLALQAHSEGGDKESLQNRPDETKYFGLVLPRKLILK